MFITPALRWREAGRWIPSASWPASIAESVSSSLVRNIFSKARSRALVEYELGVSSGFHKQVCAHIDTHKQRDGIGRRKEEREAVHTVKEPGLDCPIH